MQSDYLRNKKIKTLLNFRKETEPTKKPMTSNEYTVFILYEYANRNVENDTKNQLVGPGMQRVFDCEIAYCNDDFFYCDPSSKTTTNMPFRGYKRFLSTNEYKIKSKNNVAGYPKVHNTSCKVSDISCTEHFKEFKACFESQNIWEEDLTYIVG